MSPGKVCSGLAWKTPLPIAGFEPSNLEPVDTHTHTLTLPGIAVQNIIYEINDMKFTLPFHDCIAELPSRMSYLSPGVLLPT